MKYGDNEIILTREAFVKLAGAFGCALASLVAGMGAVDALAAEPSMTATFFDVGKADAIVLQSAGHCVVVDTGTAASADAVVQSMTDLGVAEVDALVITHFDQDHVGGAAAILRSFPVEDVYVTYESKDSDEVDSYHAALDETGIEPIELAVGSTLDLTVGSMDLHFIAPESTDYGENDTSNDSSLVIRLTCDGVTMLFTGDIERSRIGELLAGNEDLTCDLLKMPHHGGYEKNTDDLIEACAPAYAVITSSKAEKEDDKTVDDLKDAGVEYYLTRKGTVTATVMDGELSVGQ